MPRADTTTARAEARGSESRVCWGRALSTRWLRGMMAGFGVAQAAVGPGMWWHLSPNETVGWWASVLTVVVGLGVAGVFVVAWRRGGVVSRSEAVAATVLALAPIGASCAIIAASRGDLLGSLTSPIAASVLVAPLAPALSRVWERLGTGDADWTLHEATARDRAGAVVGVTVMAGAWTAAVGAAAASVSFAIRLPADDFVLSECLGLMAVAHAMGLAAGAAGSVVTAYFLRRTRLDRSLRLVFIPTAIVGVLGCAFAPPVGVVFAGITMVGMSMLARERWPLFERWCCEKCGYDLRASVGEVCPECGAGGSASEIGPDRAG